MAGLINLYAGPQRSGKTLLAVIQARGFNIPIYTNMSMEGAITINSLEEIPLDYAPKILLLDEAYYFMDSRAWKDNTTNAIFWNTLGKQNIALFCTAPQVGMIEKRIREQASYVFFAKNFGDKDQYGNEVITYKGIDVQRGKSRIFKISKCEEVFEFANYSTLDVPDYVDCSLKNFIKPVLKK